MTVKQSFDLERSGAYSTLIAVRWWNTDCLEQVKDRRVEDTKTENTHNFLSF